MPGDSRGRHAITAGVDIYDNGYKNDSIYLHVFSPQSIALTELPNDSSKYRIIISMIIGYV